MDDRYPGERVNRPVWDLTKYNVLQNVGLGCAGLVRWAGDAPAASYVGVRHTDGESGNRSDR